MLIAAFLVSYLLGAIPFGWILAKLVKGIDLHQFGSGNIGATNAGRALGRWAALLIYLLDFGKGFLPTHFFVSWFSLDASNTWIPVGLGSIAVLGHCFPVYLKFRGGKGVATTTGVMLSLDPLAIALSGGTWFVTLALFKFVALASVVMALALPFFVYCIETGQTFEQRLPTLLFSITIALFIVFTHRTNLSRIFKGEEPKIGAKKT